MVCGIAIMQKRWSLCGVAIKNNVDFATDP